MPHRTAQDRNDRPQDTVPSSALTAARAPERPTEPHAEPIAIVGIGCRFPGAHGPREFWRLLRDGVDAITEVPPERYDVDAVYDPRPATPGKTVTRWGGFLDRVDAFDAAFFGISPREAGRMDPQQRLLLEVAWEALEDGGLVAERLPSQQTGVYVGVMAVEYDDLLFEDPPSVNVYSVVGSGRSTIAGRLSYALGLQGPSLTLDTACSSSLVAIHLACQSLRSGESKVALAGGVNLILLPKYSIGFSQAGMLSPDGRCKAFDARANGFVRSEGAAVVVLKPLADALADGDPIYAVIRGSAVNNDGRSGGLLMTPSQVGQETVLRAAYADAGIAPSRVQYVEAHGTGTSAGDPVEARALGAVLGPDRPASQPCHIGSVKTNIGHTEGAAGVAGVIKAALALKHKLLPPSLHCPEPNPSIPWQELPLVVQRELSAWPEHEGPALAGVNSFGIVGTNAHVVLEEAPPAPVPAAARPDAATGAEAEAYILPLSAHSPEALAAAASAHRDVLTAGMDDTGASLRDLCYTASVRRAHLDHRLAAVGHSREELAERLDAALRGEDVRGLAAGRVTGAGQPKVVFVCPGQGGQWFGMARRLLDQEPVFRTALEACDRAMGRYVEWSLLEELSAPEATSRLREGAEAIDVLQPALFAIQVALAALWRSWGVTPAAVVGHSMGEAAAAYIAGALSLDDAARVICLRSKLLRTVSGRGGMAVTDLSWEQAEQALLDYPGRIAIAAANGPSSTVLSGELDALTELLASLEQRNVFCRLVRVDVASHSPQMDPLRGELLRLLEGMRPQAASVPIYSTVTSAISDGLDMDASYWMRNLRQPVLFAASVRRLLDDGHTAFVELSPHPTLIAAVQQTARHLGREAWALPSLRRHEDERATLLEALGGLHTHGYPVAWERLYPEGGRCVSLPLYPWQHERFWLDDAGPGQRRAYTGTAVYHPGSGEQGHPLLGRHLASAAAPGEHLWELDLELRHLPYLGDHRVQGRAVLPGAAYAVMALDAAREALGPGAHALEGISFERALFVPEEGARRVQAVLSPQGAEGSAALAFRVFSRGEERADGGNDEDGGESAAPEWVLHASGTIRLGAAEGEDGAAGRETPAAIRARCREELAGEEQYRVMRERGLEYGPAFQGIARVWRRDGESLAQMVVPEEVAAEASAYQIHPALLDACFQTLLAALPGRTAAALADDLVLPVGIESLRVHRQPDPGAALWCHTLARAAASETAEAADGGETLAGDVVLLDEQGTVVAEVSGLRIQRLEGAAGLASAADVADWLYEVAWQEVPAASTAASASGTQPAGRWLLFADGSGAGQALRARLEARGAACVVVTPGWRYARSELGEIQLNPSDPTDFRRLLAELAEASTPAGAPTWRGIVHLWSLDAAPPDATTGATLDAARALGPGSVLHLLQALSGAGWSAPPRLWLVTSGAQAVSAADRAVRVAAAPLLGLARVLPHEHPELRCVRVDLSAEPDEDELDALAGMLLADGREDEREDELALRGARRYAPRLVRQPPLEGQESEQSAVMPAVGLETHVDHESLRVEIARPGSLDALAVRPSARVRPGPGQVEIEVGAAGLNFIDVLRAMGVYPGQPAGPLPLGMECSGRIVALGEGVDGFQVGDEVIGVTPSTGSCLSRYVTTAAGLVVLKPGSLTVEEGAILPIAFLTAAYALHHLARVAAGERVLIHAASGGVGLAAVQLAQRAGAEVFATAGSQAKRDYLLSLGVRHVMDSRSLTFADEVMARTGGQGVDVVLNSLTGDAISKSLATLRAYGRFIELGKRDIYAGSQLGLAPFKNNLSYFAVDVDGLLRERPAVAGAILRAALAGFSDSTLAPLPSRIFPLAETTEAFRQLAHADHIGKVGITFDRSVPALPVATREMPIRGDGTYLITGGLGGIGLAVAQWLVRAGARALVLVGRSAPSPAASVVLDELRAAGARVLAPRADIASERDVRRVLATAAESLPPLRGVIHAAGILDDGILLQLDQQRLAAVMAPKVAGAWHLHTQTAHLPLDFFVLFSSAAALVGSPGQGNYTAANAFLDALAHLRRAQGLPALSVNWGAWAEVGLAVRPDRGGRLALRGLRSFTPEQGLEALERLLRAGVTQAAVMPFDARRWARYYPGAATSSLLGKMVREAADAARRTPAPASQRAGLTEEVRAADPTARRGLMETYLTEQVAKVLRLPAARLEVSRPLNTLGLDSLMAVELRNRIESDLGVTVSVIDLLQGPSIAALAGQVAEQLAPAEAGPAQTPPLPAAAAVTDGDTMLSFAQRRLWFLDQLDPDSVADNVPLALRLVGELDVEALRATLSEIVRRHQTLRTTFVAVEGAPLLVVAPEHAVALPVEDLGGVAAEEREAEMWRRTSAEVRVPFDLGRGPVFRARLLRMSDEDHLLVLTMHHIASDGWSLAVLLRELVTLYTAFSQGEPSPLPEPPLQFAEHAGWQRQMLHGETLERELRYWREQLAGAPTVLELPTDRPRPAVQSYQGAYHRFTLPTDLLDGLKALSRVEGATLFMTLMAALDTLLYRYTAQEDIVVGSAIAGRTRPEVEGLIGPFFNILPLRAHLGDDPTYRELLGRVREVALGAYAHQDVPYEKLVEELQPERSLSFSPLVQVVMHLHNLPIPERLEAPGLELRPFELDTGTVKSELLFNFRETEEGLTCSLGYSSDLFDAPTIARLEGHLRTLLAAVVRAPDERISALPLLTPAEREQVVTAWNATEADFPRDRCLHELVEEQVARSPEAVAVRFAGERLTYAALDQRANRLAWRLRRLGVRPETRVGVCMERSVELVVGLLAVLKAGGAYVPLDPTYPAERLATMLADAAPPVLLTQRRLLPSLPNLPAGTRERTHLLCLDDAWSDDEDAAEANGDAEAPLPNLAGPDDIAYVIYTSGSTGVPKGVEIPHRGIVNRMHWMQQTYRLTPADRVLQKTPFTFDVSVWEFFWPLLSGATLVLARPEGHRDNAYLVELIAEQGITTLHFVPSMLEAFLEQPDLARRAASLRRVICSGEALPAAFVARCFARLPGVELHNLYGPTEASIDVTAWRCQPVPPETAMASVPIGRPIANTQVYVLDGRMQPVPIGVPGELYLGGVGLARGYLHRPELTAERFVPDPFRTAGPDEPAARLYRTGDQVRWRVDRADGADGSDGADRDAGALEFLGRLDQQVKLRGYRIELGEIEAALRTHPTVGDAVVLARPDPRGEIRLVAYVVPRGAAAHASQAEVDEALDEGDLRTHLQQKLPDYMLPAAWVRLGTLPLTTSGKVDRRALPDPAWASRSQAAGAYVAPASALERTVAAAMAETLGLERVGVHDDFFALGGHSLLAMQLLFRLRTEVEVELPLRAIFQSSTVAGLARTIEALRMGERVDEVGASLAELRADAELDPAIIVPEGRAVPARQVRHIFLTGATGFLGAFVLAELLRTTQAKITCLVRAPDARAARERLRRHLADYGLWDDQLGGRIAVVAGDLTRPWLGLAPRQRTVLARQVDVIYHCGAQVNFVYSYADLKAANVRGTQEVLRLACQYRAKPVHYVSTLSIFAAEDGLAGRAIGEDEPLDEHLARLSAGYDRSKWVAEQLVRAAGARGLPVSIYRPGLVAGHSQTGVSNADDVMSRAIKGCIQLGSWPESEVGVHVAPVDYVSRAIVHLSRRAASRGKVFHLVNAREVSMSQLLDWLRALGYPLRRLPYHAWRAELLQAAHASAENALYPLLPLFPEGQTAGALRADRARFTSRATEQRLRGSGIVCPALDEAMLGRFLSYFQRVGFIEGPPGRVERAEEYGGMLVPVPAGRGVADDGAG